MADQWLYSKSGEPAFYQQGMYIYSAKTHKCEYFESSGYIYDISTGIIAFFVKNGWYTMEGSPEYSKSIGGNRINRMAPAGMAISFDQREAFRMLAGSPNGSTDSVTRPQAVGSARA
jgi:hypothetical protein